MEGSSMPSFGQLFKRSLIAILAVGILGISWYAIQEFAPHDDRYQVPFGQIETSPPPTYVPRSWLREVQSLSGLPEVLDTRAADLPSQLKEAFARSPWVESVEFAAIRSHRRIECRVQFRIPAAVVTLAPEVFLVDGNGVVLPRGPQTSALEATLLPIRGAAAPPNRGISHPWGSAAVEAAARIAAVVGRERDAWQLASIDLDEDPLQTDARLRTRKGTVIIWETISANGSRDPAVAAEKMRRLREYCARYGGLDGPSGPYELDLRPPDGILRRSIRP
jgi:hypothetical protein